LCWAEYRTQNKDKIISQKKEHYAKNRGRLLREKRIQYLTDGEKKREYQRKYTEQNKEKVSLKNKDFFKNNPNYYKDFRKKFPEKLNAKENKRKAAKLNRTPAWLTEDDHWMIEQAYELAALRTKIFGFKWHVDHIIPLQGKTVSGLHVPINLQVIPWKDNLLKSNSFKE
jgi:hypothetical protein